MTLVPDAPSILIVDDDENIRLILRIALQDDGFEVREAATGVAALELAESASLDVVLLDQNLPDLDGREVLRRLRTTPAGVTLPVIFLTGRRRSTERVAGLDAGADDYVTKPFQVDELLARVRAQVRGRNVWRDRVEALRERNVLASMLARIADDRPAADASADVASILTGLGAVTHVEILEINHDGTASVLASATAPGFTPPAAPPSSEPLSDVRGTDVRPALSAGAGIVAVPTTNGPCESVVCRIGRRDRPTAAVILSTGDATRGGASSPPASDVLAAMAEVGPIIERLLVPRLELRASSEAELAETRAILSSDAFESVFQPIVDVHTRKPIGYEALTRFADGTRPDLRFDQARRCGLGGELEVAALRLALTRAVELPPHAYVSLNLSATTLLSGALPALDDLVHDGRRVIIEITEHEHIDNYEDVRAALAKLGPTVGLAVDDAGSGYASLRHVLALRPDVVKLDRGWVSGVDGDPARQALITGIVAFVERLGGSVVAEGVEQDAELSALKQLGVRYAQGYLLGRPTAASSGEPSG